MRSVFYKHTLFATNTHELKDALFFDGLGGLLCQINVPKGYTLRILAESHLHKRRQPWLGNTTE